MPILKPVAASSAARQRHCRFAAAGPAFAVGLLLLLAACTGDGSSPPQSPPPTQSPPPEAPPPAPPPQPVFRCAPDAAAPSVAQADARCQATGQTS